MMNMIITLNTSVGTIAIVCMAMVFFALAILLVIYLMIPKILDFYFYEKEKVANRKSSKKNTKESEIEINKEPIEANVNAAIAMAIYLMESELHDDDRHVLTIEQVKNRYSPWSSKSYGVMNNQL